MVRSSRAAGVEECKGTIEDSQLPLEDEREDDNGGVVTLYVTVHSDGQSHIVPFHFSPTGNTAQVCIGIHDTEELMWKAICSAQDSHAIIVCGAKATIFTYGPRKKHLG